MRNLSLVAGAVAGATVLVGASTASNSDLNRTLYVADWLTACQFNPSGGVFPNEDLWQSGNTVEALSNLMNLLGGTPRYADILQAAYLRTSPVVDNCFDDHQWWILGWVRAYQATGVNDYLVRAAQAFDFVAATGWEKTCGGGILWCPAPAGVYKNAITNELFLTAAMELHPYTSSLGKPANYYLDWAMKEWNWFTNSGMINPATGLVNDGLTNDCQNNNGTTWTYNQGVLLDGAGLLSQATGNASILAVASGVASATMTQLVDSNGVLVEPCDSRVNNCDGDQQIFKGIFVRHLGRYALMDGAVTQQAMAFLSANAASLLANDACATGGYGLDWRGPCGSDNGTATHSASLDLLTAAALNGVYPQPVNWQPLGLGNCADSANNSVSNCFTTGISEAACAAAASSFTGALAYDHQLKCDGSTFCRVRSLAASSQACTSALGNGWGFTGGSATRVNSTMAAAQTICMVPAVGGESR